MATCWTDGRTGPRRPGVHSFRTRARTHTQTYTHTDTRAANFARSPPRTTTPPPRRARTDTRGDVNERWHTALSPPGVRVRYSCPVAATYCTVQNTPWGYFPSLVQQQPLPLPPPPPPPTPPLPLPLPLPLWPCSRRRSRCRTTTVGDDGHANIFIILSVTITIHCTVQRV